MGAVFCTTIDFNFKLKKHRFQQLHLVKSNILTHTRETFLE